MFRVDVIIEAENEIRELLKTDPVQAGRLVAVIDEISENARGLDILTDYGFENEDFDVGLFLHFQNQELRNVWRLKIFGFSERRGDYTIDYRVIYAPDYRRNTIHILGIMPRKKNYEEDREFVKEIKERYDRLGLPILPKG